MAKRVKKAIPETDLVVSLEHNVESFSFSDYDLDDSIPLPDTYGENLKFESPDGDKLKSVVRRDKNGYREVSLEITSYMGSIGAVHFYAKLRDHSISISRVEDKKAQSSVGGYTTKNVPKKYTDFHVEVCRPVEQKDIDHDIDYGRDEYLISKIGNHTRGFWEEEDAIKTGIAVFKMLFKGKWRLKINPYYDIQVDDVFADKVK